MKNSPFFYSKGKFNVVYFWMTIILGFVCLFLGVKLIQVLYELVQYIFYLGDPPSVSDALIAILTGGVVAWTKFYNDHKEKNGVVDQAKNTAKSLLKNKGN